jgi:hypothetical protein
VRADRHRVLPLFDSPAILRGHYYDLH